MRFCEYNNSVMAYIFLLAIVIRAPLHERRKDQCAEKRKEIIILSMFVRKERCVTNCYPSLNLGRL